VLVSAIEPTPLVVHARRDRYLLKAHFHIMRLTTRT
jgi:hypothetical protein